MLVTQAALFLEAGSVLYVSGFHLELQTPQTVQNT